MSSPASLHLTVVLPTDVLLAEECAEVIVRTVGGPYGILPRHADFATALTSGIFEYHTQGGQRGFVAADGGLAVKQGDRLLVATPQGAVSADAAELAHRVRHIFLVADEREIAAREAMGRLEASLTRGLWEMRRRERAS